jgi:hypothetical protein
MHESKPRQSVVSSLLACLIVVCISFAGDSEQKSSASIDTKDQIRAFGDLDVELMDPESPETRKVMLILRKGAPFLLISENQSGEIDGFEVLNGKHGEIARGTVDSNGISLFGVFGNSLNGQERTPLLVFGASKTPGQWRDVTYGARKPPKGKDYYPLVGETYEDLDFDGQFDAKRVYNSKSEMVAQAIYLDGLWKEILRVNDDGVFLKIGKYYSDSGTAFFVEGEQRTHYRFVSGVGWAVEDIDRASDGWDTDPADPVGKGEWFDDISRILKEQKGVLSRLPVRKWEGKSQKQVEEGQQKDRWK